MSRTQKYTMIMILVGFWAIAVLSPLFVHDFKPPPEINAAIPSLIGMILALPAKSNGSSNSRVASRDEEREGE